MNPFDSQEKLRREFIFDPIQNTTVSAILPTTTAEYFTTPSPSITTKHVTALGTTQSYPLTTPIPFSDNKDLSDTSIASLPIKTTPTGILLPPSSSTTPIPQGGSGSMNVGLVAGVSAGSFVFLALLAGGYFCYKKFSSWKERVDHALESVENPVVPKPQELDQDLQHPLEENRSRASSEENRSRTSSEKDGGSWASRERDVEGRRKFRKAPKAGRVTPGTAFSRRRMLPPPDQEDSQSVASVHSRE